MGLILAGVAVRRRGRWTGWRGLVVLVAGIFVFVPMLPALMEPFVLARPSTTVWSCSSRPLATRSGRPTSDEQVAPLGELTLKDPVDDRHLAGRPSSCVLDVTPSWRVPVIGAVIAAAGHILRAIISLLLVTGLVDDEGAAVNGLIVATIPLMFGGMAILGVSLLRTVLACVPGGLGPPWRLHFMLLGLLWGATWMALGLAVRTWPRANRPQLNSSG